MSNQFSDWATLTYIKHYYYYYYYYYSIGTYEGAGKAAHVPIIKPPINNNKNKSFY
jgi:hypothetical protein